MRHTRVTDEVSERAALYALGVLGPEETARFETHLVEGCRPCEQEVRTFAAVRDDLGQSAQPGRPPAGLRQRVLARARAERGAPPWALVRAAEDAWQPGHLPGTSIRTLFGDREAGRVTILLRLEPGAAYPSHEHADTEEVYVLAGDLRVDGHALRAGDYSAAPAGTVHRVTESPSGCTLLVQASEHDRAAAVDRAAQTDAGPIVARAEGATWEPGPAPGVSRRHLFTDPARGTHTLVVRMAPGAVLPPHRHRTAEQLYMLEGDGHVSGQVLGPGDYFRVPAGTTHGATRTDGGCTFLLLASRSEALA
jgi:quercetin dioxygenase-like cupin family protein